MILNERKYAEEILTTKQSKNQIASSFGLLARYFRDLGYSKDETSRRLEEFAVSNGGGSCLRRYADIIDKCVASAGKRPLVEINSVPVTQHDRDLCGGIGTEQRARLLFTLICLARYANAVNSKNSGWVNMPDTEIFKLADVKVASKTRQLYLNDLMRRGLISFSKIVDNTNINVKCIEDDESPVISHISNFTDLGYQYSALMGEDYVECTKCGRYFKKKIHSMKVCETCSASLCNTP